LQLITTLYGHKSMTTCVNWCTLAKTRGIERANSSILASGDERGVIVVWEAKKARKLCAFIEGIKKYHRNLTFNRQWIWPEKINYSIEVDV
jgi:hypothetical protein